LFRSCSCTSHRGLSGSVQMRKQPANENSPIHDIPQFHVLQNDQQLWL
jgi:hypothetical protein